MAIRRRARHSHVLLDLPEIIQLWLFRLLVPLGVHRNIIDQHGIKDDTLAEMLGLGEWGYPAAGDFDLKSIRDQLRSRHQTCERKLSNSRPPTCLSSNINRLSTLVGLSETDCRILEFAVLIQNELILADTADWLGQLPSVKVFQALSILLQIPVEEIRASLSVHSVLYKSGLVSIDYSSPSTLSQKLDLLSNTFADHILSFDADPISLLRDTVVLGSAAKLSISDYNHITLSLSVLRPYLKCSIAAKRRGVNIFLHGKPGTGKSQLAKVLAQELNCELFEVASEDEDGEPAKGERRLRSFRAAQSFFAQREALILFDEVEDVFNDGNRFLGQKSTAQIRKAWINRILEENPVPTFWLSNSIEELDPAFIRRFDMVFELPIPPKGQRERILLDRCSDLLDANSLTRIAQSESLAPAVVMRAASVLRSIRDELDSTSSATAFELLINNTLEAQGHIPIRKYNPNQLPEIYDPLFIHADANLSQIGAGLIELKSGRLCLYGPPGTGKTAYGQWLAEQLSIPIIVKRASDLMSMWVGENEKNIARAFKQAEQEGALLLIDEVDSFLQDRRGAHRGWEVSLVNEMLTQMESFPGIFIATLNLLEGTDQAALRRFDLKVKFGFLAPDQARELLRRSCIKLSITSPKVEQFDQLNHMSNLTPGDFAAVFRQHLFRPISSPDELLSALQAECSLKECARLPIGFV